MLIISFPVGNTDFSPNLFHFSVFTVKKKYKKLPCLLNNKYLYRLQDFAVTSKATLWYHDILLDATVDFDVFSKKNQKITLTAKLVRNQISNGFNVTGFISTKGKVSEHCRKRMAYFCFNFFSPKNN
jgi:hypothetical protein